jgi:transcription elongation factor Elf1
MNTEYRYQLESPRVTGRRQQKFTCPQCGRKRCFVRYVDTSNECRYVGDTCGRCDHEQSCGYHLKPAEYYHDNPWQIEAGQGSAASGRRDSGSPIATHTLPNTSLHPMPAEYVDRCRSQRSTFWQWLSTVAAQRLDIGNDDLQRVSDDYRLGATKDGGVIFWQQDCQGRVRSGHIMHYDAGGHRCGYQGWVHVHLIRLGLLPQDWQLHQCLFGEHLLNARPECTVCLVESEKTAVVMAALYPNYLWLATCGSNGLTADRVSCLKERKVVVFPDSGCLQKWTERLRESPLTNYSVSTAMESYRDNTDMLDLLMGEAELKLSQ